MSGGSTGLEGRGGLEGGDPLGAPIPLEGPIARCVEPIPGDRPAGADIREEPGGQDLYYRLKDARSAARLAERTLDPEEAMRVPPEWKEVRDGAREALADHTKDVEIVCWLVEAELRLDGLAGLAAALAVSQALVERFWDGLHGVDTETVADKVAPFAGLNGSGAEGVLIQPLRFVALVPGAPFFEAGLWAYGRDDDAALREAAAAAGREAMAAHLAAADAARRAFAALNAALDERCGIDAPPSSNIRNILDDIAAAIRDLGGLGEGEGAGEDAASTGTSVMPDDAAADAPAAAAAPAEPRPLETREDAFRQLMEVADFFRRTEPHSPLSFAIETLVRRGRMPFPELLEELMPDNQARQLFLTAAGIRPQSDGD